MSDHVVPHFHNDAGVPVIEIGSQEFMCVGANPPFDPLRSFSHIAYIGGPPNVFVVNPT